MRNAVLAACVVSGSVALAWAAPQAELPKNPPEVRPGEIVIKPTGRTRVVRHALPTTRPVVVQGATQADAREDADNAPPPRVVSIGYLLREPEERGWGPQIHYADYYAPSYAYPSCDPGYSSPLWGSSYFSSAYFGSSDHGGHRDAACRSTPLEWGRRR